VFELLNKTIAGVKEQGQKELPKKAEALGTAKQVIGGGISTCWESRGAAEVI
jgi:hypothetical protein